MTTMLWRPMAKSSDDPKPHASHLRRGTRTPADLRKEAQVLMAQAAELDNMAAEIEKAGVKRVSIDGDKKFVNGTRLVWEFIGAVSKGMIDAQYRR